MLWWNGDVVCEGFRFTGFVNNCRTWWSCNVLKFVHKPSPKAPHLFIAFHRVSIELPVAECSLDSLNYLPLAQNPFTQSTVLSDSISLSNESISELPAS